MTHRRYTGIGLGLGIEVRTEAAALAWPTRWALQSSGLLRR
jgi:hypothetical protein